MLKNSVLEARDIWKGYNSANGACRWILQGVNLEIMKGDFVAILGGPGAGKTALLKVLGFREPPDRGAIYFEGRLVGRRGPVELEELCAERVWLIDAAVQGNRIVIDPSKRLAAVLVDNPLEAVSGGAETLLLEQLHSLAETGVAVIMATREPAIAARAAVIYKLSGGKLEKITGKFEGHYS